MNNKVKNTYITAGIKVKVPIPIQEFIFFIYNLTPTDKDYIQVFRLNEVKGNNTTFQRVEQSQEVPAFKREYLIVTDEAINEKIFIVDDGENVVMMLAEEY